MFHKNIKINVFNKIFICQIISNFMQSLINKITPSKKERENVNRVITSFFNKIKHKLKDANPELGGSMAKDTWLAGDHDIDVFVKFPYEEYKTKYISKILQERLKGIKYEVMHGSRDYLQVKQGKYLFELIPVLDIKHHSKHENITDISPLHAQYVKRNNYDPIQIRIFKAFLKANNFYGAESYIKGFSGYIAELLIIYYNGFSNLITAASNWKNRTIIDMSEYYKNVNEVLANLNKDKQSNLILIDPVQPNRNAAAALSEEKYFEFINLCKNYLRKPSKEYFELKDFNLKKLKKKSKKNKLITFIINPLDGKPDVVGSKILKVFNYIKDNITNTGFSIIESKWQWKDKALLYYIVRNEKLSKYITHLGPYSKDLENVKKFKEKWKKIYYDKDRVYVKIKRKNDTINKFAKSLLRDNYIKQNIKSIKLKIY